MPRQLNCIAAVFVKCPRHCGDEHGMTLQPGVHIRNGVYRKTSFAEERNNIVCSRLHRGALLRYIKISNGVTFESSSDTWKCQHNPRASKDCQQLLGAMSVIDQEHDPLDCSCLC